MEMDFCRRLLRKMREKRSDGSKSGHDREY